MERLSDRAAQYESQGSGFDRSMLRQYPWIHEIGPRRVIGDRAGIEKDPWLAVDIQLIAAEVPSVPRIEALVGGIRDGAVELRDQESTPMINSDDGRADRHVYRHAHHLRPLRAVRHVPAERRIRRSIFPNATLQYT